MEAGCSGKVTCPIWDRVQVNSRMDLGLSWADSPSAEGNRGGIEDL